MPGHLAADADAARRLRHRREHRPRLEARPVGVGEDRIEVVEVPRRLEQLDVVGGAPDVEHVGPGGVLRCGLDPEAHARTLDRPHTGSASRSPRCRRCCRSRRCRSSSAAGAGPRVGIPVRRLRGGRSGAGTRQCHLAHEEDEPGRVERDVGNLSRRHVERDRVVAHRREEEVRHENLVVTVIPAGGVVLVIRRTIRLHAPRRGCLYILGATCNGRTVPGPSTSREAILVATRRAIIERGPGRLTLSAVAAAAGVSRPTLYRWFPTKEDLLVAFADYEEQQFDAGLRAVVGDCRSPAREARRRVAILVTYLDDLWARIRSGPTRTSRLRSLARSLPIQVGSMVRLLGDAFQQVPAVRSSAPVRANRRRSCSYAWPTRTS